FFAQEFKVISDIVAESGVDKETNWMAPNYLTRTQRNLAQTALKLLPPVETLAKKAELSRKAILKKEPQFEWVGVLGKNGTKWQCMENNTLPQRSGSLYLFRKQPDGKVKAVQIGTAESGKVALSGDTASYLRCTPVFFHKP
ncbi:MAG: hypothetical protein LBT89_05760, partial [Planctomycetaceae bacterium]|nr:hypothetical protein [Planctomycetaceae bacterium]